MIQVLDNLGNRAVDLSASCVRYDDSDDVQVTGHYSAAELNDCHWSEQLVQEAQVLEQQAPGPEPPGPVPEPGA